MTLHYRPNIENLSDCIKRLDSWDATGPDRELDCRIAYALGRDWWSDRGWWRALCDRDGFEEAWSYEPVWDRNVLFNYTSSYDAVVREIGEVMPEADQISWSCDPSGCGASVGVWHLSAPVTELEEHQPYIWPHGKGYANSGLHAMLRAFLQAVLQRERGDVFDVPKTSTNDLE